MTPKIIVFIMCLFALTALTNPNVDSFSSLNLLGKVMSIGFLAFLVIVFGVVIKSLIKKK